MTLSNSDIDLLLINLVEQARLFNVYAYIVFDSLYKNGLRINELIDYSRISQIDVNTYLVQTQKFSNPRYLNSSQFNSLYLSAFGLSQLDSFIRSYSFYTNFFINYLQPYKSILVDNKQITTHLFRHNYCKKLFDLGYSIRDISTDIGERSDTNTSNYVFSNISAI